MKYRAGFKYQLAATEVFESAIRPAKGVATSRLDLSPSGKLTISPGYAWDGPSGPTLDSKSAMRGSLFHDAIYQLIRQGHLDARWREYADKEFGRMLEEDGMWWWRRKIWVRSVKWFAGAAADPKNVKKIFTAP